MRSVALMEVNQSTPSPSPSPSSTEGGLIEDIGGFLGGLLGGSPNPSPSTSTGAPMQAAPTPTPEPTTTTKPVPRSRQTPRESDRTQGNRDQADRPAPAAVAPLGTPGVGQAVPALPVQPASVAGGVDPLLAILIVLAALALAGLGYSWGARRGSRSRPATAEPEPEMGTERALGFVEGLHAMAAEVGGSPPPSRRRHLRLLD